MYIDSAKLFSQLLTSFYSPTSKAEKIQFSPDLPHFCIFSFFSVIQFNHHFK